MQDPTGKAAVVTGSAADISATLLALLQKREPTSSICPSDVARALAGEESEWRALMQPVRDVAAALARKEVIVITQGKQQVDPANVDQGPIRLRRGPAFPAG